MRGEAYKEYFALALLKSKTKAKAFKKCLGFKVTKGRCVRDEERTKLLKLAVEKET